MPKEEKLTQEKLDESLFLFLVRMLSEQAWISLGRIVNPVTQEQESNLEQASTFIDILGVLEKRTRGNLTKDEETFLKQNLTSLRLTFVEDRKAESGGTGPRVDETDNEAPAAARPSKKGAAANKAGKEGRVLESDEEGRAKVVDRRSSTADTKE